MRPSIKTRDAALLLLVPVALGCYALCPRTQATPLPGFNTADGQNALFSVTTGSANAAVGWFSLSSNAEGSFNTATGAGALLFNTADENTAFGAAALLFNTTGPGNTAIGAAALLNNTEAGENTAVGTSALSNNTTGAENTADGAFTLFSNTSGFGNTAVGSNALFSNTTGGTLGTTQGIDVGPNTAIGASALISNTTASANTAVGYQALGRNTTGLQDTDLGLSTAVGFQALANATGPGAAFNDAFGYQALFHLNAGMSNVAIGGHALFASTIGSNNVALGNQSGVNITTGNENICIGLGAGLGLTTGSNNIRIGDASGQNEDDTIRVGRGGVQTRTIVAGIFGAVVPGGTAVVVNSEGQLGTTPSSNRFKDGIKPMNRTSEAILALKPVTFHYKNDNTQTPQFGLIAEKVAQVNPDLVVRDKDGRPYSVRYDQVNAMLLNEFLKEHKTVRELKKEITTLTTRLKEQDAKIQKISAQVEMNKPATRVALNNPQSG
jgi:hypothetical protein